MNNWYRLFRISFVCFASFIVVLALAQEVEARGRGGGGGRRGGGSVSRGGSAQWGSMGGGSRSNRGGGYKSGSYNRGSRSGSYDDRRSRNSSSSQKSRYEKSREQSQSSGGLNTRPRSNTGSQSTKTRPGRSIETSKTVDGDTTKREATITGRGGETVEYSGSTTRTEDGISRSGSLEGSRGGSSSGQADIEIGQKGVEDVERKRSAETAGGESIDREISSERDGNWRVREGEVKTSTGVDAETASVFTKTDDGFIARGAFEGGDYAGAGTVVRDGNGSYRRGAITDGDDIRFGRTHCSGGTCYGARTTVDIDSYYYSPYYHYPYYYAYYACPHYSSSVIIGYYGTPVYSCSNVYVVSTTVVMSSRSSSSGDSSSTGSSLPIEVQATSAPVVMYGLDEAGVVYSTSYEPSSVYSSKKAGRYYWVPGVAEKTKQADTWIERALESEKPSANATVITYTIGDQLVYLTNEPPAAGIHSQQADQLYAWIAGTSEPSLEEADALATALAAHHGGGSASLEREVRKLQESKEPPTLPTKES